jgi:hypothetical protein
MRLRLKLAAIINEKKFYCNQKRMRRFFFQLAIDLRDPPVL